MAPEKTVDIGSFSIASKADKHFVLGVSTSMTLLLPDHFPDHMTAKELRDRVQAGALWLTRARSCRLTLAVHFELPAGVSIEEGAQWRQLIIETFPSLRVWCDLGLELRPELDDLRSDRTPSATSVYHIQHAQEHSGLFVPQGVPCGYLSNLSCSFRYAATTSTAPGTAEISGLRSRVNTCYNLRKLVRTQVELRPVKIAAFWGLPWAKQAEKVVDVTQNALNLMLGLRTRCVGFESVEGTKQPALLEVAPAVWNAQYFQRVVSRAKLIPAISSALGNLRSTQSLALRRVIEALVPEAAADSGPEDVLDELQRRTQVLLLRSARDQKTKIPVPKGFTSNDFTDYANLDLCNETLRRREGSQPQESISGFADQEMMYSELESSHGFTDFFSAGSPESSRINFGPEDACMSNGKERVGWSDDDVAIYESGSLMEYCDFYDRDCAGGETFDLTRGDQEHQEQYVDTAAAFQEHDTETAGFYYESDSYDPDKEMLDIEGKVQPTAPSFENRSSESGRAAGTREESEGDFSDFIADEYDVVDIGIHDHLREEGICSEGYHEDPWGPNDDQDGSMPYEDDTDDEPEPYYITRGHVHHDEAEAAGSNTWVGSRKAPEDWDQVPRNHADHGTDERWGHPGPHATKVTRRVTGNQ